MKRNGEDRREGDEGEWRGGEGRYHLGHATSYDSHIVGIPIASIYIDIIKSLVSVSVQWTFKNHSVTHSFLVMTKIRVPSLIYSD